MGKRGSVSIGRKLRLKNPVARTTKKLGVLDTVRGGPNICIRVDADSSRCLEQLQVQCGYDSRSKLISHALRDFLHAFRTEKDPMSLLEMQYYGAKRGKNPPEKVAQWQAHDPEVVKQVKLLEQGHNLSRTIIGRAAVARFIAEHDVDVAAAED